MQNRIHVAARVSPRLERATGSTLKVARGARNPIKPRQIELRKRRRGRPAGRPPARRAANERKIMGKIAIAEGRAVTG